VSNTGGENEPSYGEGATDDQTDAVAKLDQEMLPDDDGGAADTNPDKPTPLPNRQPENLQKELDDAERAGVTPTTVSLDSKDFNELADKSVQSGDTVKWAVTTDNELVVAPEHADDGTEIKHPVLTDGGDVLAAGEARFDRDGDGGLVVDLNDHSGHYQPPGDRLALGTKAFEDRGIRVVEDET